MTKRPAIRFLLPGPRPSTPMALAALVLALALAACDSQGSAPPGDDVLDVPSADGLQDSVVDLGRGGGGEYPGTATEAQVLALGQVNRYRSAAGLEPVDEVAALNAAAQAHADFIVGNCGNYSTSGLSPHEEDSGWSGYTGVTLKDRLLAAGYAGPGGFPWYMSEVIAFLNQPGLAVDGWIGTLYHRLPLLDPRTRQIGYGGANIGKDAPVCYNHQFWNADVIDVGMVDDIPDAAVLYPPDGAKRVPTSFDGLESPTPIAPPRGFPCGTIVTVQFGKDLPFTVTGHRLLEYGTDPLPHVIVASKKDDAAVVLADPSLHDDRALALYAFDPLKAGTDYTVVLDLVRDGAPLHLEWSFKTNYVQD